MSDKNLQATDMTKLPCSDCAGCGHCCQGMGDTIYLDPYDMYQLTTNLGQSFDELLGSKIGLTVEEGMIRPHLMMNEQEQCAFLDEEKKCSIHGFRPGICRLFPLGRDYKNGSFTYFVVEGECVSEKLTKSKISKWIGVPRMQKYEAFVSKWHYFVRQMQSKFMLSGDDAYNKQMNLFILQTFFIAPYDKNKDFYEMFDKRMEQVIKVLG